MTANFSFGKAGIWIFCLILSLSLHETEAQTNTTATGVPGWGIALLVLTSLVLACILCSLVCLPLVWKYVGQDSHRK